MSWTLTTSGAAIRKAGLRADSITASGAAIDNWGDHAEGKIMSETARDWVSGYASVADGVKNILSDVASSLIAIQIIGYNMGGYTSRAEAQTMIDIQYDTYNKGLNFLKDFDSNDIKSVS